MALAPSAPAIYRNFELVPPLQAGILALVSAALLGVPDSWAQTQKSEKSATRDKVQNSLAIAKWTGDTPSENSETTALCVKKNGWYICLVPTATANTAAANRRLTLTIDGVETESQILTTDAESGLCLAKAHPSEKENAKPLTLSAGKKLLPGTEILPMHGGTARLAGKDCEYLGEILPVSMLRIHLSEKPPTCSGQPLFTPNGEVAGLLTNRKLQNAHEAHAIPAARISKLLEDYAQHKRTGKIWIGASFHRQSTTPEVVAVKPNSPAEKAGLQSGDIVLKIDKKVISNLPELAEICETLPAGQPVSLEILRGLKTINCELTPALAESDF